MHRVEIQGRARASAVSRRPHPVAAADHAEGALEARFHDEVDTRIVYANLEFARYFGLDAYEEICLSGKYSYSGFGEWFFKNRSPLPTCPITPTTISTASTRPAAITPTASGRSFARSAPAWIVFSISS